MSVIVRAPIPADHAQWYELFAGYQRFYRGKIPDDTIQFTWDRILSPDETMSALVAESDGNLVGLAHFLYHDSTWNKRQSCYLEDLFVDKGARGFGVGKKLMEQVEEVAKTNNAFRLYLHTQSYNGAARSLYDTVIAMSPFVVYRKNI